MVGSGCEARELVRLTCREVTLEAGGRIVLRYVTGRRGVCRVGA